MLVDELRDHGLPSSYIDILKKRGIRELNPVQREAISKGALREVNMVISAPTASGKTLIAEMALVKTTLSNRIGIYLTPLRALASEKYSEFKKLEEIGLRVGISTGDYDHTAEYLGEFDIVIATYERFDSLMRLKPEWLKRLSLVVVDELHNINDPERGPIIEIIVARSLRDNIRILGLSATIGNPERLADWIRGVLVQSNWRPVKLVEGVFDKRKSRIVFIDKREESIKREFRDNILDIALHSVERNYQTLVFIHNRKKVEEYAIKTSRILPKIHGNNELRLLDRLDEAPTSFERELLGELLSRGVGFHHAGLSHYTRSIIEEAFRSRLIKILYATPTLAAGVNLPARRVLVSIKRYDPEEGRRGNISVSEYKQMAGRAGRPQFDEVGEAIIIDATSIEEGLNYINSSPEPVRGNFYNDRSFRIHTLATIASGDAATIEQVVELFEYTFSAMDNPDVDYRDRVVNAIHLLEKLNMVYRRDGEYYATKLGKITSYCYIDPYTVDLFLRYKPENPSDLYLLHLISLTPDFTRSAPYIPSRVQSRLEDLLEIYSDEGLIVKFDNDSFDYDTWLNGFIYALALNDWINEKSEDEIYEKYGLGPGDMYNIRDTASWISGSLGKISGVLGDIRYFKVLTTLSQRIDKGVKEDAVELASIRGIGRVRARILIENGIKTIQDLAKTPSKRLLSLPTFGPRIVEDIKKQLVEIGYEVTP